MMRSVFRPKDSQPASAEDNVLARRFEARVRLSWFALLGERIWEALLWPFLVVTAFIVVSLLELWSLFPPVLHRVLLGGFGLVLIISFLPLLPTSSIGRLPPMRIASAPRRPRRLRRCGPRIGSGCRA
jgi:hypothetical protein